MITLRKIIAEDQTWLTPAMNEYLTEIVPGQTPPKLSEWWSDAERDAYAIEAPERVGFAMVRWSEDQRWEMSEFTIFAKARRKGIGRAAVTEIMRHRPGPWQLGVVRQPAAQAFWPGVLRGIPGLRDLRECAPMTEFQVLSYRFTIEGGMDVQRDLV